MHTVANLLTSGGYTGLWDADDGNDDNPHSGEPGRWMDANIGLAPPQSQWRVEWELER